MFAGTITNWLKQKAIRLATASSPPFPFYDTLLDVCPTTGTFRTESLATIGTAQTLQQQLGRCLFITLARNFGFGLNGDAFETWANRIPLRAVDKHRDELFQIEAFFFGQAGLLQGTAGDEYYLRLKKEYEYLSHKFGLTPMDVSQWRFLRLRPTNFPHIRIAQLAVLYHRSYGLLSRIMEAETVTKVHEILKGGTSAYWVNHYTFEHPSPSRPKH